MTAVAGSTFSAAQFNQYVRDNLNETAPAKATAAGQFFVATGANAIAARTPTSATVATSETTTSTSYADLATVGPAATVTTGVAAMVFIKSGIDKNTANIGTFMSFAVSGGGRRQRGQHRRGHGGEPGQDRGRVPGDRLERRVEHLHREIQGGQRQHRDLHPARSDRAAVLRI
jgi:hypothetical protein